VRGNCLAPEIAVLAKHFNRFLGAGVANPAGQSSSFGLHIPSSTTIPSPCGNGGITILFGQKLGSARKRFLPRH